MPFYKLGNILRGGVSGEFESDEEAWEVLSKEFDKRSFNLAGRDGFLGTEIERRIASIQM